MAILVLGFSICAHSSFLHDEEDEDQMASEDNQTDDKNEEAVDDKDDNFEEGHVLEQAAELDNAGYSKCIKYKEICKVETYPTQCCRPTICLKSSLFPWGYCKHERNYI